MPDLCEIVAKVKKTKENLSETTIIVFNFFNFFIFFLTFLTIWGTPLPGGSLGDGLRSEHITLVPLCSSGWLREVGPDSYVVPLPDRDEGPQNS